MAFAFFLLRGALCRLGSRFCGAGCVASVLLGGFVMRCEPILTAMEYVGRACAGGSCADCTAVGFCLSLKKVSGFTIKQLAQNFDEFFFGVSRQNKVVVPMGERTLF